MEMLNLKRGCGKTSYLIVRSFLTGKRILCVNAKHKQVLKHLAVKMGVDFPKEPITVDMLRTGNYGGEELLVDDALEVLCQILDYYGAKIDTMTLSVPEGDINAQE